VCNRAPLLRNLNVDTSKSERSTFWFVTLSNEALNSSKFGCENEASVFNLVFHIKQK
jgi:hypothetical protein